MNSFQLFTKLDQLNQFNFENIELQNSLYRYGFAHLLADILKLKRPRRSFCNWIHGWIWWDDIMKSVDIIGPALLPVDIPVIVGSNYEKKIIVNEGIKNKVCVGGLPYAYCPNFEIEKNRDTLVAVIAHSAEAERHQVLDQNYLDYLHSIKKDWDSVFVLIYYLDLNDMLISEIKKRGLKYIVGANPYDRFSLIRMKLIFTMADAVNSNVMGSHIAYALASNCKVSLVDDLYSYDPVITIKANQGFLMDEVERCRYAASRDYLLKKYSYLFTDPSNGVRDVQLGNKYIGREHLLSNTKLKSIIGWTLNGQIKGYSKGFLRKGKKWFENCF